MSRKVLLALVLAVLVGSAVLAEDYVSAGGSMKYPVKTEANINGSAVTLKLTGAAMRTRVVFNVYTVGSYVQDGAAVRSAEQLAAADVPKMLHLVFERDLDGKDMATAFRDAIRANYPAPAFDQELATLLQFLQETPVKKGDQFVLTHVPGQGCRGVLVGKKEIAIKNPAFTKAIWDIYLGKNNLGAAIKQGLAARL